MKRVILFTLFGLLLASTALGQSLGTFSYLGMRLSMTKVQATGSLDKWRNISLRCNAFKDKDGVPTEMCDGQENELRLSLTFRNGTLVGIYANDKYSPFGSFVYGVIKENGQPYKRTDTEATWRIPHKEELDVRLMKGEATLFLTKVGF